MRLQFDDEWIPVQEIIMPALGMASTEVYLVEWVKQPGDEVVIGETIALVETDKAELTIEATEPGIMGKHLFEAETSVPAGATIAFILGSGETEPATASSTSSLDGVESVPEVSPSVVDDASKSDRQETQDDPSATSERVILISADRLRDAESQELEPYVLSPHARAELLLRIPRIEIAQCASNQEPSPRRAAVSKVTEPHGGERSTTLQGEDDANAKYRSAVSRAVSRSWAEIPHFAVIREIRTEALQVVLKSFRAVSPAVTFTDLLVKTFALSLIDRMESTSIDIGLAIASPRGVAISVLESVATADLLAISQARKAAVERAVQGRPNAVDGTSPHSTLSNLGNYGVDSFTGIVPFGQTSLLTVGAAAERPVVEQGSIVVGHSMTLTLNVDHRHWDGQHAAEVLQRFAAIAAEPTLLLALGQSEEPSTRRAQK